MPRARILVVDDEPSILRLMSEVFDDDVEVHVAPGVSASRSLLEHQRFDLVIADMRMPDGTAREVIAAARAHHPGVRTMIICAVPSALEPPQVDADFVLDKPFGIRSQLLPAVWNLIGHPPTPH